MKKKRNNNTKLLIILSILISITMQQEAPKCFLQNELNITALGAGLYDPTTIDHESCKQSCQDPLAGYEYYGLTGKAVCICSHEEFPVSAKDEYCNVYKCPGDDSLYCGGYEPGNMTIGQSLSILGGSTGSLGLTCVDFILLGSAEGVSITNITASGGSTQLFLAIGDADLGIYLNSTEDFFLDHTDAGPLQVTIYGPGNVLKSHVAEVSVPNKPIFVFCDYVASLTEDFHCSVAVAGSLGEVTVTFGSVENVYEIPGSEIEYFGRTVTKQDEGPYVDPKIQLETVGTAGRVIIFDKPVEHQLMVTEVRGYTGASGTIEIHIYKDLKACPGTTNHRRWHLLEDEIEDKEQNCRDPGCSLCTESGGFETIRYEAVSFSGPVMSESLDVDPPLWVNPGDYLGVKIVGAVGVSNNTGGGSPDMDQDGVEYDKLHYVQLVAARVSFYDVLNRCTTEDAVKDVVVSVTSVSGEIMTNVTRCQVPIEDFNATILPATSVQDDSKSEFDVDYYYRAKVDEDIVLSASISQGGPVYYTVKIEGNDPDSLDRHKNNTDTGAETFSISIGEPGEYLVNFKAYNLHSEPEYGHVGYTHNVTRNLVIQHPIEGWTMELEPSWLDMNGAYTGHLKLPVPEYKKPTDAHVQCDWGDDSTAFYSELNSMSSNVSESSIDYPFEHTYQNPGYYNVTCRMWNLISEMNFPAPELYGWFEAIQDFQVELRYIPMGLDEESDPGLEALGPDKNQLPLDRNITLFFSYTKGTIEEIRVTNITNDSTIDLGTFPVTDPFNARNFRLSFNFSYEAVYNISVEARNGAMLENDEPFWITIINTFEIVGKVFGLEVNDYRQITAMEEEKPFEVRFQSIGGGTCLYIDFADGVKRVYGDETFCSTWKPDTTYEPVSAALTTPFHINHTYWYNGVYNVTAEAFNKMTAEPATAELMVIVTGAPCTPPKLSIPFNSSNNLVPTEFYRSEKVVYETVAVYDCGDIYSTRKLWRLFSADVNITDGGSETLTGQKLENNAPQTFNQSKLIIPALQLEYGVYKLFYTARMWDAAEADPSLTRTLPFETTVHTYFKIKPTPLVAMILNGAPSKVTRGLGQTLKLEPYLYTVDPDYPELEYNEIEFVWLCREITETFQLLDDGGFNDTVKHKVPKTRLEDTSQGGCFGTGPGVLEVAAGSEGILDIPSEVFHQMNTEYEILFMARKDTRNSTASVTVHIVSDAIPVPEISCASQALCHLGPTGEQYINPTSRLGLRAVCLNSQGSDCTSPLQYRWKIQSADSDDPIVSLADSDYGIGCEVQDGEDLCSADLGLKKQFFNDFPLDSYIIHLVLVNGNGNEGLISMTMKVNKPPTGGKCSVSGPPDKDLGSITSLVDELTFTCVDWTDPEESGIKSYKLKSYNVVEQKSSVLMSVERFSADKPSTFRLPPGTFKFTVEVHDVWGAATTKEIDVSVVVDMPTTEQMKELEESGFIEKAMSSGDMNLMSSVVVAQMAISEQADSDMLLEESSLNQNLSPEEKEEKMAASAGQKKIDAVKSLKDNGGSLATSPDGVIMVAETVNMILGPPKTEGKPSTVGLEVTETVISITEDLVESTKKMEMASPEEITPMASAIFENLGTLLDVMKPDSEKNSTEDPEELCKSVSPIDKLNADKPGTEYETEIGDDYEMSIPEDSSAQHCKGLAAATDELGKKAGSSITGMINDISHLILSNSVIGEEFEVDAKSIQVYTKMATGEGAKEEFEVLDTGVKVKLPNHFCLEQQFNHTCSAPVGITAVVYTVNPRIDGVFSDRLAADTLHLDCKLSNRNHEPTGVTEVFDPPKSEIPGIRITIPRRLSKAETISPPVFVNATSISPTQRSVPMHHMIPVPKADSTITIEIQPTADNHNLHLFLSHEKIPTYRSFMYEKRVKNMSRTLPNTEGDGMYYWFVDNSLIQNRTGGRWFLTVIDLKEDLSYQEILMQTFDQAKIGNFQTDYHLRAYTSGCYYLDEGHEVWTGKHMKVLKSTYDETVCLSSHLTLFASGFFIQPTSLDFEYIKAKADFADNVSVYMTVILVVLCYLVSLIISRWQDGRDNKRVRCKGLPDNCIEDTYAYEIVVLTGSKSEATCKSKVHFILTGDRNETDVREFPHGKDDYFVKGGINSFVMTCSRPLGNLNILRIWHDNSGIGNYASWFLGAVIIRDLVTNKKYQFISNRWLAVEKYPEQIDLKIPENKEMISLKEIYLQNKENSLKQNHLWIAPFFRPSRSRYTRCQRIAACFTFIFTAMLGNVFLYEQFEVSSVPATVDWSVLDLSEIEIIIGVLANLYSFPVVFLVTVLFKFSRPFKLRENRIISALKNGFGYGTKSETKSALVETAEVETLHTTKYEKLLLPPIFKLLSWFICLVMAVISILFCFTHAVVMGNDKIHRWLACLMVTFFSSLLVIEPIKVVLVAVLNHVLCKLDVDDDIDDADVDEERLKIKPSEDWESNKPIKKTKIYVPYSALHLDKLKQARIKELKSQAFAKDIITYIIFLSCIFIISIENRDSYSYMFKAQIEKNFILKNGFHKLLTTDDYWRWAHSTLIQELKAGPLYNGKPPYGYRGFVGDHTQRIIGFGTLRQIRVKRNTCMVAPSVVNLTRECAQQSNMINEENRHFCNAWHERNELTKNLPSCMNPEFRYRTAEELQGLPIRAKKDVYLGGGYIIKIKGTNSDISEKLTRLQQQHWINNQTRAVLLEFGVYNVNLNLFAVCTIVAEWLPGGGVAPYYRIDPIRLWTPLDLFGAITFISQFTCFCFIVYFTLRETTLFIKLKMSYWSSYWAFVEWGIIIDAFAAICFNVLKQIETKRILDVFSKTYGNGYIKMQYVGFLDEIYGYTIGMLMFMAVLRLLKIMEFNNRMSMLIFTLNRCWSELSGFLVIFFFAFFSFVQLFFFILYSDMYDFKNIMSAFQTCFTMMLNKFKFGTLLDTSVTAAVMFFFFAVSVNFILINVLLTIILEGYESVRSELEGKKNELEVIQYMKDVVMFMVGAKKRPGFLHEFSPEGLKNDEIVRKKEKDSDKDDIEESVVNELPDKVDEILKYINVTYFGGELDLETKKILEKGMKDDQNTIKLQ